MLVTDRPTRPMRPLARERDHLREMVRDTAPVVLAKPRRTRTKKVAG